MGRFAEVLVRLGRGIRIATIYSMHALSQSQRSASPTGAAHHYSGGEKTMSNQSTEQTVGPLRAAYIAAQISAETAQAEYDAYAGEDASEEDRLLNSSTAADLALDAAREALAESDEPRDYELWDGVSGTDSWHGSPSEVEQAWHDWMAEGEWGDRTETSWVTGHVTDEFDQTESYCYTIYAIEAE